MTHLELKRVLLESLLHLDIFDLWKTRVLGGWHFYHLSFCDAYKNSKNVNNQQYWMRLSKIPVQRSTNWANKPTGSRSLNWFVLNPWKDDDEEVNICDSSPLSSHTWFSYIHNFIIILSWVYNEPIHRYRKGQGFESHASLNFFQTFFSQLQKLRLQLWWFSFI